VKARLFWKVGSVCFGLVLLVLLSVDTYVAFSLRREYMNAAYEKLESLSRLAQGTLPDQTSGVVLQDWAARTARAGVRVTLVGRDGKVLADSDEDAARMDNHAGRPEIRAAMETGSGRAERRSATTGHNLVYLATRQQAKDGKPIIVRFSLPVQRLNEALAGFRRGLWSVSFIILLLAAAAALLFSRSFSARIERLKEFSRRVAAGDFRALPMDRKGDELADLAATLGQTASQLDATIRTLTKERNQSAAVLASMAEGVVVTGPDRKVIFCNEAFARALSIATTDWAGRPVIEVIPNADLLSLLQLARPGTAPVTSEVVLGSVRTKSFAVTVSPVRSADAAAGTVMVLHDITELRRLERARRDFAANVSHEFKTPLAAIQGFAETLLDGALEDKENSLRFLEIIRKNALRLGRLTEDLLKLAQIEAGKLELQCLPVAVSAVITPCLETVRLAANQKNLILEADCGRDLPLVKGDVAALQQILQNLLDNAVRHSPRGGRLRVQAALQGAEVVISVSDMGSGIPKTEQERIFERFYRADAGRSRDEGGTGLGLSIAKHLAEAQGGRIQVQSEIGLGSTFSLFLQGVGPPVK
jgi:two-component system phosphate regulon sensor histidine kinase PhoR